MQKKPQCQALLRDGFTLVEIMIVVAIIALLASIAVPNFLRAREQSQLAAIVNNLRVLEGAKDQWALENKKGTGAEPTWDADAKGIGEYLKGGTIKDVVGEKYVINSVGTGAHAELPAGVKLGTYKSGAKIENN
jgi:prepilin-type N-terminal cleavage/methylation domain-containing protein